jgi:hypothetical protein
MTRDLQPVPKQTSTGPLCIVIADNPETTDGLHAYLSGAGVPTRTSRRLRDADALCAHADALVLFPDEYELGEVDANLRALRHAHPRLLMLLVTALPQRVRPACEPAAGSVAPLVLPRPAFGWRLLDAIRAHQQRAP